jgi:hypothetical protein
VKYHKDSELHKESIRRQSAAKEKAKGEVTPIQQSLMKLDEAWMLEMEKLFTTAYYVAVHERPFSDFPKLLELQTVNGLSLGDTYCNEMAGKKFVQHIAGTYFDDLQTSLVNSPFISIFSDVDR